MNKITLLTAIAMIGFTVNSFGQSSTIGEASVTVIAPLTIVETTPLHFGTIAAYDVDGSLEVTPVSGSTPTNLKAVTAANAAVFTVSGDETQDFSVTLPDGTAGNEIYLTDDVGTGEQMLVSDFTTDTDGTLTGGTNTVNVGAKLNVNANQAAGDYSGTYDVIVQYN